jgi:hypothetical protein
VPYKISIFKADFNFICKIMIITIATTMAEVGERGEKREKENELNIPAVWLY